MVYKVNPKEVYFTLNVSSYGPKVKEYSLVMTFNE